MQSLCNKGLPCIEIIVYPAERECVHIPLPPLKQTTTPLFGPFGLFSSTCLFWKKHKAPIRAKDPGPSFPKKSAVCIARILI